MSQIAQPPILILTEAQPRHLEFYLTCFAQKDFRRGYDLELNQADFHEKVCEIATRSYKNVTRFILERNNRPVAFCHFVVDANYAMVSGGIIPDLFSSGFGVVASVIFYQHFLTSTNINELRAHIRSSNHSSIRVHQALGFTTQSDSKNETRLSLQSSTFPNLFGQNILIRNPYASR